MKNVVQTKTHISGHILPAIRRSFFRGSAKVWQRESMAARESARCHTFALPREKERLIAG